MRKVLVPAILAAVFVHPAMAMAQDAPAYPPASATVADTSPSDDIHASTTTFRGIRVEGDIGGDRFKADGDHHTKLGYGGTVGFDGQYKRFVLGAEGSFWRADDGNRVFSDTTAGTLTRGSYNEWGAAIRAGYLLTPQLLVFGKGGYVSNEQSIRFTPTEGTSSYGRYKTDGYQYGGGVEYSLPIMNMPVYLTAQYVRSQYDDHTSRQRLMGGVGLRFK